MKRAGSTSTGPFRPLEALLTRALGDGVWADGVLGDLGEGYHRRRRQGSRLAAEGWYATQAASLLFYHVFRRGGNRSNGGNRSDGGDRIGSNRTSGGSAAEARWALRAATRRPLLSLAVVLTLGLGLGANVAVLGVVGGTLDATSWWDEPDRTLVMWPGHVFSRGLIWLFQQDAPAFSELGGYDVSAYAVASDGAESETVTGALMTPGLFRSLRVAPTLGRGLADDDARPGGPATMVVSHAFWRTRLGSDPDVLGRTLSVNGQPRTIVGVQGPGGHAPGSDTDVWMPLVLDPNDPDFFPAYEITAVGILAPGADAAAGRESLRAFGRATSARFPFFFRPDFLQDAGVRVARDHEQEVVRAPLYLLVGGTLALLLVAVLDVATMLLARATDRTRELAVRRALGATRGQIVRQLAGEAALLALLVTGVAALTAGPATEAVAGLFPTDVSIVARAPGPAGVRLPAVLGGLAAWAFLTVVPLVAFLASDGRGLRAPEVVRGDPRRVLVATQAGLATALLVAAALLLGSVRNLQDVPLGFEPDGATAVTLTPSAALSGDRARLAALQRDVVERAAALPGVRAAGMTSLLPLERAPLLMPANPEDARVEASEAVQVQRFAVDAGYFRAMGIAVVAGRTFASTEEGASPTGVVIDRTLADQFWPGGDAVGREVAIDPHAWDRFLPVLGVVETVRAEGLVGPALPTLYVALAESPQRETTLVLASGSGAAPSARTIRDLIAGVDPTIPVGRVRPVSGVVRDAYGAAWVTMGLVAALAVLCTALAAVGIYAMLSYSVAQRRREIGVRMAMGAEAGRVVRGVVRTGLTATAVGVAAGCAVAAAASGVLGSLLTGVSPLAGWAYALPALVVLLTAALAATVPALRAGRLPPADVLRDG